MASVPPTAFCMSLHIQRRVLHALLMREIITRFGRDNIGVLWFIGEPMIFTLGIVTLWSVARVGHSASIPVAAFAVTGYSSVLLWRNSAGRAGGAVEQNRPLLYHRNVQVLDTLIVRILVEVAGATGSFILLSTFFGFIGWMRAPVDLLSVIGGWLMLAWFGASLALLIGAGSALSPMVERLWHPVAYLLFPMSGAAFMVDWLPVSLQSAVLMLPMVHGVELVREGFFGNVVATHYDMPYMAACCLLMTLLGLALVRLAARRVEF